MYDSVPADQKWNLAYRTVQGLATTFFLFDAVRYLPLVEVALITNLMPLFVAIFGYLYLKERLKLSEIAVLVICFFGVAILILGGNSKSKNSED